MLLKLSFLALILTFGQFARGQVAQPGRCPDVKVMTEFDLEAYTGLWYQYARYPTVWEVGYECEYAKYGDLGDNTVSVHNGAINSRSGSIYDIYGYAKVLGPATLAVVFFEGQSETEPNYQVLGTDYKTYAVVFSCSKLPVGHGQFLWVLTRYPIPSKETIEAAMKVIEDNGLSKSYLTKTEQQSCRPVIDPDQINDGGA